MRESTELRKCNGHLVDSVPEKHCSQASEVITESNHTALNDLLTDLLNTLHHYSYEFKTYYYMLHHRLPECSDRSSGFKVSINVTSCYYFTVSIVTNICIANTPYS